MLNLHTSTMNFPNSSTPFLIGENIMKVFPRYKKYISHFNLVPTYIVTLFSTEKSKLNARHLEHPIPTKTRRGKY